MANRIALLTSCVRRFHMKIFDRKALAMHRKRMLRPDYKVYEYIRETVGGRLADRVLDIKRENFDRILDLWCCTGSVAKHLPSCNDLVLCDISQRFIDITADLCQDQEVKSPLVIDETCEIPQLPCCDLIVSNLALHWVNDIPTFLSNIYTSLNEEGSFIASLFIEDNLFELRVSLQLAECERLGGVQPHMPPTLTPTTLIELFEGSKFVLITVDIDELKVAYPSLVDILCDIRTMGESNCAFSRPVSLRKDVLMAAEAIYRQKFGNEDGSLPATFRVGYVIGWKLSPEKVQTVPRGAPKVSLKDAFS